MRDFNTAFVNTNSVAFPNTEAVNSSSPSATDGTEFIKIMIDDGAGWGYVQALFDEAEITPNGTAEAVGASQKLDALEILFGIPLGYISGFLPVIAADTDHDISFGVGEARSALASSLKRIALATALIKQIDVDWAPGTNDGGFPSGLTLAIDTWYHLFVIKNNTTKVVDAGFDTSLVATNLLADASGYTEFKRIGSVLTDGSSNISGFTSYELPSGLRIFMWDDPPLDLNDATITVRETVGPFSVPPGLNIYGIFTGRTDNADFYLSTPAVDDEAPSNSAAPLALASSNNSPYFRLITDTSGQLSARSGGAGTIRIVTHGWEE